MRAAGAAVKKRAPESKKKAEAAKNEPTLAEALAWLRRALENYGGHSVAYPSGIVERTYQVGRTDAYEFELTAIERVRIESLRFETRTTARINLAQLQMPGPAYRGRDELQPDALFYAIALTSRESDIPIETRVDDGFPSRYLSGVVGITFKSEAMANRVVAAFKHAITLCQNQKEPF